MMKKLFLFLMTLAFVMPLWASEHTVTISSNDAQYDEDLGVYYCVKDGVMMTFTDGLDNENYLVERHDEVFYIRSYNYIIRKIVFHCVDNTVESNLDCFYWGPTTMYVFKNFTYPDQLGNYYIENNGYDGVWTGQTNNIQFKTKGKPVRFGSVEIIYDKLEGDIFDLVTNNSQIVDGKTYVIVSRYHEKVMAFKKTDDISYPVTNIVEWMNADKTKVKVDGNACLFKMENLKDSTIGSNTRKVAWFNTLNGHIREGSGTNAGNLLTTTSLNDYARAIMYISSTENNFLCWFKNGTGNSTHTIRYDYDNELLKILSTNNAQQRVWLYKLAESYTISTECTPPYGGYIILGEGAVEGTSQQYETVQFYVGTNWGYRIRQVVVVNNETGEETVLTPDEVSDAGNNYSFIMPDANVTIRAEFYESEQDLYILGTANGQTTWYPYGPKFNYDPVKEEYYIDVYFKGTNDNDPYGYFSLTKKIDLGGNWDNISGYRLAAEYNNYGVADGSSDVILYGGTYYQNNAFKIPAGVYRITVNKDMNRMAIDEYELTLPFTPEGGEVPLGTEVSISSNLDQLVHDINPAEDYATFNIGTDGENYIEDDNIVLNTAGETTVYGKANIGCIKVTGHEDYIVIETPLHYIEDKGEEGKTYTIADQLLGVFAFDNSLWCKDLGNISLAKTEPGQDQIDYLMSIDETARPGGWDQSNWVELILGTPQQASAGVGQLIKAGSVKGRYTDDLNYKIEVLNAPLELDGAMAYTPNTYCTVNFLEDNLTLAEGEPGAISSVTGDDYYFLNPKIQEYALVTFAMWDKSQGIFVVPAKVGNVENAHDFNGAIGLDPENGWYYNEYGDVTDMLDLDENADNVYMFHILVQRYDYSYGGPMRASIKPGQSASTVLKAYPLDLTVDGNHVITAVAEVRPAAQVESVRYFNATGMESDRPFDGINIVVTRYTDGSSRTVKVLN